MEGNQGIITLCYDGTFFNVHDTLTCGQIFRYIPYKKGYKVYSNDRCAYLYNDQNKTIVNLLEKDKDYFEHFFDLSTDYLQIVNRAVNTNVQILQISATLGKGIRILNQDKIETLFSFVVSQNNNIPRIKGIIEKLCQGLGEKKTFLGEQYFTFPTVEKMAQAPLSFYKEIGLGYRAEYIKNLAIDIANGLDVLSFDNLDTPDLKNSLIKLRGIGPKVADCVALFGYHRADSFPVDTWIAKVYEQDFKGTLKDRKKIADWFVDKFKGDAGFYQQYLFYYKRTLSNQ